MRNGRAWAGWAAAVFLAACGSSSGGGGQRAPDGGVGQQCAPTTCAAQGKSCGAVPDGCGVTLDCGSCPAGEACGAANVCVAAVADGGSDGGAGGTADGGTGGTAGGGSGGTAGNCVPTSCQTQAKNCGVAPDGCGGTLACGSCGNGKVCGASGACEVPPPTCTTTTCAAAGKNCGNFPDGCGGTLACGSCGGGQSCGGGGAANVCGTPPVKGGDTRWSAFVDSGTDDAVQKVAVDRDGNVLAAGLSGLGTTPGAIFLRKYGADGRLAWEKRWTYSGQLYAAVGGLAVSPLGNLFLAVQVSCYLRGCQAPDLGSGAIQGGVLVKLDNAGAFVWQVAPGEAVGQVTADGQGGVAVAAYASGGGFVARYDFTGKQRWTVRADYSSALALDPPGNLAYFATLVVNGEYQASLSRLDPDGKLLWRRKVDGYIPELAATEKGTVVAREVDHLAVYEAADGAQRFRTPVPMWTTGLGVDPAGRAAVAGADSSGCHDLAVRYYTLDGVFQWSRMVGATGSCGGAPQPMSAVIRAGGDVVVGGQVTAPADMGKGLYSPKSADGFVLDLAP